MPVSPNLAQLTTDLDAVKDSGISEVTGEEWLLAGLIAVATIVLAIVTRRLVERAIRGRGHPTLCHLGGRFAGALIVLLGFFYAASSIDIAIGPLIAGLGILGVALAFALQDMLANFAAGIMLQARRPIRIGDQIVTNEIEGEVEDINFRSVKLRDFDGETVYVPNMMVITNAITNWTKNPSRRTRLELGVAYDTDLAVAKRVLAEAVASVELVHAEPAPAVLVHEFAESSINFTLFFWHGATIAEEWEARDAVAQAAKRALDAASITIPFPQRTLWFGPGNEELHLRSSAGEAA